MDERLKKMKLVLKEIGCCPKWENSDLVSQFGRSVGWTVSQMVGWSVCQSVSQSIPHPSLVIQTKSKVRIDCLPGDLALA